MDKAEVWKSNFGIAYNKTIGAFGTVTYCGEIAESKIAILYVPGAAIGRPPPAEPFIKALVNGLTIDREFATIDGAEIAALKHIVITLEEEQKNLLQKLEKTVKQHKDLSTAIIRGTISINKPLYEKVLSILKSNSSRCCDDGDDIEALATALTNGLHNPCEKAIEHCRSSSVGLGETIK